MKVFHYFCRQLMCCKMKRILFFVFFCGLNVFLYGQSQVQYDKEPIIDTIEQAYQRAWKSVKGIDGYRIQLVASSTRKNAQNVYNEFTTSFPEVSAYLSYMEPTFRVRVGNLKNRIEAYRFLMRIQYQFPGAFITKDKISFKDI